MKSNKNDICVIGMGCYGRSIVEELVRLRRYVLALDQDEKALHPVAGLANQIAVVDASDITGLKGLGIKRFNTVVVAVTNNITIIASLLELGITHIITKAENVQQERVLKQIGVDIIIKPEIEAGIRTALIAANTEFIKFSKAVEEIGDDYAILSTVIKNKEWTEKPLNKLPFSERGINIISIKRKGKIYLPDATFKLLSDDLVTLIGKNKALIKILDTLASI